MRKQDTTDGLLISLTLIKGKKKRRLVGFDSIMEVKHERGGGGPAELESEAWERSTTMMGIRVACQGSFSSSGKSACSRRRASRYSRIPPGTLFLSFSLFFSLRLGPAAVYGLSFSFQPSESSSKTFAGLLFCLSLFSFSRNVAYPTSVNDEKYRDV